jgi:hypothetical protein
MVRARATPPSPPPQEDWEPCYVRFGDEPEGGRSFDWQLGEYESGVSVFRAFRTPYDEYMLDFLESPLLATTYVWVSTVGSRRPYRVHGVPWARVNVFCPALNSSVWALPRFGRW